MFCVMKPLGANTIMPILLRELSPLIFTVKGASLTECYVLLNDVQAYYLSRNEPPNSYYQQMGTTLLDMLDKYGLKWVVDQEAMRRYAIRFLIEEGFQEVEGGFIPPDNLELTVEDQVLLRSILMEGYPPIEDLTESVCSES